MTANAGLDPANLTPAASLNRVRFVALPGLDLPQEMVGKTAYDLLSARSLSEMVQRLGDNAAAAQYGTRLGWLLVTLLRGDDAARAVRADWDASYWQHWGSIHTVWLGGGLASSRQGTTIVQRTTALLHKHGLTDRSVRLAAWPAHLPLVGAARAGWDATRDTPQPGSDQAAAVLDFGSSYVKRGRAEHAGGAVVRVTVLPRRPAHWAESPGPIPDLVAIERLGQFMAQTLAETWIEVHSQHMAVSDQIFASFASYVRDGQPLPRQGGPYAALLALSDNLNEWLSERASAVAGHPLTVRLLHDGTAAALALTGEPHAAIVMLGTSLGAGFPPTAGNGRPLAPGFTVEDAASQA